MPAIAARVAIWAMGALATYFTWRTADVAVNQGGNLLDKPAAQFASAALVLFGIAAVLDAKHGRR